MKRLLLALLLACTASWAQAQTCTTTISAGANVCTSASGAAAGSTVCLNNGNYGGCTLNGSSKSPRVTVRAVNSGSATFTGALNVGSNTNGFTFDGINYAGISITGASTRELTFQNGNASNGTIQIDGVTTATPNILFNNLVSNDQDNSGFCRGGAHPCVGAGAYWFSYSGRSSPVATIRAATIDGGCADGVQSGVPFILEDSNIRNKIVGACPNDPHTDAVQFYGGPFTGSIVRRNFFYSNVQVLTAYDGIDGVLIENNVFDPGPSGERRPCQIEWYADSNSSPSTMQHNTLLYRDATYPGLICLDHKTGATAGTQTIVRNNIAGGLGQNAGSTAAINTNNLYRSGGGGANLSGAPTYTGGTFPATHAGFQLTAGSLGHNGATDGTDIGSSYFGGGGSAVPSAPTNFRRAN